MDPAKIDDDVRQHLPGVTILPYERIFEDLTTLKNEHKVRIGFGYSLWDQPLKRLRLPESVGGPYEDKPSARRLLEP